MRGVPLLNVIFAFLKLITPAYVIFGQKILRIRRISNGFREYGLRLDSKNFKNLIERLFFEKLLIFYNSS